MKNFINISDLSKNDLRAIIDSAKKRKLERRRNKWATPGVCNFVKESLFIAIFVIMPTKMY